MQQCSAPLLSLLVIPNWEVFWLSWETGSFVEGELHRLEHWAMIYSIKFNKSKCQTVHLGQSNVRHKYKLGETRIWSTWWAEAQSESAVSPGRQEGKPHPRMHQTASPARQKKRLSSCIQCCSSLTSRTVYCSQLHNLQRLWRWLNVSRAAQQSWRRLVRKSPVMSGWGLGVCLVWTKRGWMWWPYCSPQLPEGCEKRTIEPCFLGSSDRMHGNGSKLFQGRFRLDSRNCFITKGGVTHSNRLSREVVDASTPDSV